MDESHIAVPPKAAPQSSPHTHGYFPHRPRHLYSATYSGKADLPYEACRVK